MFSGFGFIFRQKCLNWMKTPRRHHSEVKFIWGAEADDNVVGSIYPSAVSTVWWTYYLKNECVVYMYLFHTVPINMCHQNYGSVFWEKQNTGLYNDIDNNHFIQIITHKFITYKDHLKPILQCTVTIWPSISMQNTHLYITPLLHLIISLEIPNSCQILNWLKIIPKEHVLCGDYSRGRNNLWYINWLANIIHWNYCAKIIAIIKDAKTICHNHVLFLCYFHHSSNTIIAEYTISMKIQFQSNFIITCNCHSHCPTYMEYEVIIMCMYIGDQLNIDDREYRKQKWKWRIEAWKFDKDKWKMAMRTRSLQKNLKWQIEEDTIVHCT